MLIVAPAVAGVDLFKEGGLMDEQAFRFDIKPAEASQLDMLEHVFDPDTHGMRNEIHLTE